MRKSLDLIGKKINKLTVISKEFTIGRSRFKCQCECGNITIVDGPKLNSGQLLSCGCMIGKQPKPQLRKKEGEAVRNTIISNYRYNARKKGLEFSLSDFEMIVLFQDNCFYCGRAPYKMVNKPKCYGFFVYNGIDRMDNNKGYIKENCVSCCLECNFMKNSYHTNEFLKLIRMIYQNTINFKEPE